MGIARAQNEEIKVQNRMLDVLETKIDDVHEHVTNINQRLKVTLEEARKSDKICMVWLFVYLYITRTLFFILFDYSYIYLY